MSPYMKLSQKPKDILTLTGIERSEFEHLLQALASFDLQEPQHKVCVVCTGTGRQRQFNGDAQYANPLPDRCLVLLVYYRLYVSPAFLTLLFKAASRRHICRGIQSVRLLWEAILPLLARRQRILIAARKVSKQRRKRSGSMDDFLIDVAALVFSDEQIGGVTSL